MTSDATHCPFVDEMLWLEAIASRLGAINIRLEAIAIQQCVEPSLNRHLLWETEKVRSVPSFLSLEKVRSNRKRPRHREVRSRN